MPEEIIFTSGQLKQCRFNVKKCDFVKLYGLLRIYKLYKCFPRGKRHQIFEDSPPIQPHLGVQVATRTIPKRHK